VNLENKPKPKLVGAQALLEELFDADSRPTLRWAFYQAKKGRIPCIKVGKLVYFDPDRVREAIERGATDTPKPPRATPGGAA
jgi:hypothetical protein